MGRSPIPFAVRTTTRLTLVIAALFWGGAGIVYAAADPNNIGLAALRREQPALIGTGIPVAQTEVGYGGDPNAWEVNPVSVNQPVSLFTWLSSSGVATSFTNSVGVESVHADGVADAFYSNPPGVAPGVQHVRNFEANYFVNSIVSPRLFDSAMIVNDSWVAGVDSNLETAFDNYAATFNVLFVSGMDNALNTPPAPGSSYNGIGVGLDPAIGTSSVGPTADGRAKPDLVVSDPNVVVTSVGTPVVSGAAAVLLQAAARNDGGASTAAQATNSCVIKALLLNGAVKPPGWTNGTTRPLDARWGAGKLNVYNSWLQLHSGRAPALPSGSTTNVPVLRGWDYNSISSGMTTTGTNHYYFRLGTNATRFLGNVTLIWKRALGATSAKNLDLLLYNATNGVLVASSQSTVDNVEHLFATNLPSGRYDLQVVKRSGASQLGTENYALAFDFVSPALQIVRGTSSVNISWPVNEAGLILQSTGNLNPPIQWQNVSAAPFVTNGFNTVTLPTTNTMAYFRLTGP